MNLQQILTKASSQLKLKNIKSFKLDSELLLAKTLNVSREKVLLNLDKKIDQSNLKKYRKKKLPRGIEYLKNMN